MREPPSSTPATLRMRGVSKRFGATQALQGVDLELYEGEVHALMGENGAGKSTLIKIMTGLHTADAGIIELDGAETSVGSPADAQHLGIVAIYQEPLIFPDLTVAENIFMGHCDRGRLMDWADLYRDAAAILAQLDMNIDPRATARSLTVGEQQAVEIAKAMSQRVRVLILDEPTAALSSHEAQQLFAQIERLRAAGVALLFISHRLDEVFAIADRVSVFRDGRHISTKPISATGESQIVKEMVGRDIGSQSRRQSRAKPGDVALAVHNLSRDGAFEDVTFSIGRGEVVGFAGLVGAGRTDVALALFGIAPATSGRTEIGGEPVNLDSPQTALRHGLAYASEDRRKLGLSLPQSIAANIALPTLRRYTRLRWLLDTEAESRTAEGFRDELNIRTPSVVTAVGNLSGGNQQKVMLSKWLNTGPAILILDEPTRGVDVGAKAEVHRLVRDLADQGIAVMMISSDLPEILLMSDRIVVMRSGKVAATFDADDASQETVMTAAVGSLA